MFKVNFYCSTLQCRTLLTTNFAFAVSVLHMLKVNWILYCCCCQSWLIFGKWFSTNECEVRIAFSNFIGYSDFSTGLWIGEEEIIVVTFGTQVLAFPIFVMFVELTLQHSQHTGGHVKCVQSAGHFVDNDWQICCFLPGLHTRGSHHVSHFVLLWRPFTFGNIDLHKNGFFFF